MAVRRDYTNQYGAFVPTETQAYRNIQKPVYPEQPITAKKHGDTLHEEDMKELDKNRKTFSQFVKEGAVDQQHLKQARKLYIALCNIVDMCGFEITMLELKAGATEFYHKPFAEPMKAGQYDETTRVKR